MKPLGIADARRLIELANSRDAGKVTDAFSEQASFQNPFMREPVRGKENVRTIILRSYQSFPDWNMQAEKIVVAGNEAWAVCVFSGTHEGEFPGPEGQTIAPTHQRVVFDVMTHLLLDPRGKVALFYAFANPREVYRQLGIADGEGSPFPGGTTD